MAKARAPIAPPPSGSHGRALHRCRTSASPCSTSRREIRPSQSQRGGVAARAMCPRPVRMSSTSSEHTGPRSRSRFRPNFSLAAGISRRTPFAESRAPPRGRGGRRRGLELDSGRAVRARTMRGHCPSAPRCAVPIGGPEGRRPFRPATPVCGTRCCWPPTCSVFARLPRGHRDQMRHAWTTPAWRARRRTSAARSREALARRWATRRR